MLTRNKLILITGTALVAISTLTFFHFNNDTKILSQENNNLVVASVWDQETELYQGNRKMTVYRTPSCGCCGLWIEHMKKHGFEITDIKTDNIEEIKQQHNLSSELASCHTATIGSYVFEGHIPADEIKRFLKQKPNLKGLAVPGMPIGTPGMEAGDMKQPFEILAFDESGNIEVFQSYETY